MAHSYRVAHRLPLLCRAPKHHHRSSLHNLASSLRLDPTKIGPVVPARCAPDAVIPFTTHIATDKNKSVREHNNVKTGTRVYSDGSRLDGKLGASAVLYQTGRDPDILRYHLGSEHEYTVYEAEMVGMTMAAHLLSKTRDLEFPISMFVDNQAVVKSGDMSATKPGHYLADQFIRLMRTLRNKHRKGAIVVYWVAGHRDVSGNERADEEAKKVAADASCISSRELLPRYLRANSLPPAYHVYGSDPGPHQTDTLSYLKLTQNHH